ncbi:GH-E family nuclease [Mycobacteroides abscessus]|uniref:GH-E family nuclease n=1 Tax=Mycobacteroides abscessus TaxID=36809 RepID=UPI00266DC4FD|nr:GH-E family nuclease [Mycobacteroides abscessus]MDO3138980.1 GH-E family nuclease [Mycobacteroides abscessus subsp. abscessus]MDO3152622.1 GH-E family nuclease [Mycobacteroides abscessus subsp. abscessus]
MSGYARSTEQRTAVADHRDPARSAPTSQELLQDDPESGNTAGSDPGRRLAAFAAGSVAAIGGIAALHGLYRSGDGAAELVGWSGLLLLAMTALGGGIKLAMWGARPVIAALFDRAKERLAEPVLAVVASGAVIVGALGMWWTLRGGYASWWQQVSGESQWSLSLGVGQMLVAMLAGAALFAGGRYVTGLAKDALTDSGLLIERDRSAGKRRVPEGLWHPGLVAALIGGGAGLVLLAAGITPRLYVWITGPDVLPAVAAIVAVLVWGVGANLGWWKGLAGLWRWATDASRKAAATSGVVALLMFSAGGLGLGWFTPATVPQAHAQCPPDCGGGSNGGSYGPDASQFQPPQMPNQMPDYQGGINQPPMDQNSSISIYNTQAPSVSNSGSQGSSGQQGPQQSWDQPAHGTQIPDYQTATPYTQGPGRPNPDFNPGSQGGQANPGSNAGSQGGQPNQGVQQQAPQQPQENPAQQPNQSPNQSSDQQKIDDLTRQLQDQQQQSTQDRQRIDDLTKQLQQQNKQNQKQQQSPRFPSKDDKKDRDQQDRDKQSGDNDLSALLLGAASTRRRKQDNQQGPDTQALGQDASQAVQGLPGDVQTYVQSGQQIGQSSGQAAQGFGSAAQAGTSLASSAQSGAVNPQDAITVVQGVSQGIQGTADAINAGSQIVKTAQGEADQVAQAGGDANPQLKPQTEQFTQLNDQASQVTDLVGQGAQLTSQGAGAVNSVSSLGASGVPTDVPADVPGADQVPDAAVALLSDGGPFDPSAPASSLSPEQIQSAVQQMVSDQGLNPDEAAQLSQQMTMSIQQSAGNDESIGDAFQSAQNGPAQVSGSLRRPSLWSSTKLRTIADARRTPDGDLVSDISGKAIPAVRDENGNLLWVDRLTGKPAQEGDENAMTIPQPGTYQIGHDFGHENWRSVRQGNEEGWTQRELSELQNNGPFRLETPPENWSHQNEDKSPYSPNPDWTPERLRSEMISQVPNTSMVLEHPPVSIPAESPPRPVPVPSTPTEVVPHDPIPQGPTIMSTPANSIPPWMQQLITPSATPSAPPAVGSYQSFLTPSAPASAPAASAPGQSFAEQVTGSLQASKPTPEETGVVAGFTAFVGGVLTIFKLLSGRTT